MIDNGVSVIGAGETGASTTAGGVSSPSSDQFLRLLVLQLQFQDPLNPIRDQDFTAQLAQFGSLEQLTQVNRNLLDLGGIQQGLVNAQALNLLGRTVLVSGAHPVRVDAARPDPLFVEAGSGAVAISVSVRNSSGKLVRTLEVPSGEGRIEVAWDGTDEQGIALPDGEYSFEVVATDVEGDAVNASVLLALRVDGVSFAAGAIRLTSAGRELSFDQILEIQA